MGAVFRVVLALGLVARPGTRWGQARDRREGRIMEVFSCEGSSHRIAT